MATRALSPAKIMQLGVGFWGSKALLSAIELGLFTVLGRGPRDAETLRLQLGLHPRSARDFFDALVALGMLKRTGTRYANTPETALFLDRNKSSYVGGILEMANARLYHFWGSLTEGLRTGKAQNEAKTGEDFFGTLYADPKRLEGFLKAMTGLSIGSARAIAKKFPWKQYRTYMDRLCAGWGGRRDRTGPQTPHRARHGSTGRPADLRSLRQGARRGWAPPVCGGRFLQSPAAASRRDHHGAHPSRLESRGEDD